MVEEYEIMDHFNQNNRHGNFLVIKGKIRSGKTHLAAILARYAIYSGFSIITNIRFEDRVLRANPKIYYITSDRDFFKAYISIKGDSITIFDDAQATTASSLDTLKEKGQLIQSLMLFVGKFQSNVIYIAHLKYLPEWLKSAEPLWIYKMHQKDFHMSYDYLEWDEVRKSRKVVRIPITDDMKPLEFKTFGVPFFEITMDINRMWFELSKYEGDDLREAVQQYLVTDIKDKDKKKLLDLTEAEIVQAIMLHFGFKEVKEFSKLKFHEVFKNLYKIRL
jgi:hypothetical protein